VTNFPLFDLSEDHYQAEIALSVLMCFGNENEKEQLKPMATKLRMDYLKGAVDFDLFSEIAEILENYIREHGNLSNLLKNYLDNSPKLLANVLSRLDHI